LLDVKNPIPERSKHNSRPQATDHQHVLVRVAGRIDDELHAWRDGEILEFKDGHGGDWDEWADPSLRVREFPAYFRGYRSDELPGTPGLRRVSKGGLTPGDEKDFKRLDKIVSKSAKTFVEASSALYEIRERRLYRAKYKRFEDYCQAVHQISRQYANRLIRAGKIHSEMGTIVSKSGLQPPDNEAQLHELARLPDLESRQEVLVAAVEIVEEEGDGKLTARAIRQVVDKRLSDNASKPDSRRQLTPSKRLEKAREKLEDLEQALVQGQDPKRLVAALRRLLGG
jgi:hypothetical protein